MKAPMPGIGVVVYSKLVCVFSKTDVATPVCTLCIPMNGSRGDSRGAHPIAPNGPGEADPLLAKRLLTVTDLCRLLGMSRRWVHERTRRHEIPCYRFGTALRFDLDEILRWMAHFHAAHSTSGRAGTWES